MIELASLLYIGLGAGALMLAFAEYAAAYRKRVEPEAP